MEKVEELLPSAAPFRREGGRLLGHHDLGMYGSLLNLPVDEKEDKKNDGLDDTKGDARVQDSLLCPFHILRGIDQRDHHGHTTETLHGVLSSPNTQTIQEESEKHDSVIGACCDFHATSHMTKQWLKWTSHHGVDKALENSQGHTCCAQLQESDVSVARGGVSPLSLVSKESAKRFAIPRCHRSPLHTFWCGTYSTTPSHPILPILVPATVPFSHARPACVLSTPFPPLKI